MDPIFTNNRWSIFFGVLILFLSIVGMLGYIPRAMVLNPYFIYLYILGIILGGLLIERGIAPYFLKSSSSMQKGKSKKR